MNTIWDALDPSKRPAPKPEAVAPTRRSKGVNKCAVMRNSLLEGPKLTSELAKLVGIESSAVYPLLKHDLRMGRVKIVGKHYFLVQELDRHMPGKVQAAARLLEELGWSLTPPTVTTPARGLPAE